MVGRHASATAFQAIDVPDGTPGPHAGRGRRGVLRIRHGLPAQARPGPGPG